MPHNAAPRPAVPRNLLALTGWLALCLGAGVLGSALTRPALPTWYAGLAKPAWTPPDAVFPPVWTALFVAMAVAAWLVGHRTGWRGFTRGGAPLALFGLQLALNVLWSALFFALRSPGAALAELVLLAAAIAATALVFRRYSAPAAALLLPYLAWVAYAGVLNLAIWRLNV